MTEVSLCVQGCFETKDAARRWTEHLHSDMAPVRRRLEWRTKRRQKWLGNKTSRGQGGRQ